MHILVIDGGHVEAEFRAKFGPGHTYTFVEDGFQYHFHGLPPELRAATNAADVTFCFSDGAPLWEEAGKIVFYEATALNLPQKILHWHQAVHGNSKPETQSLATLFGFCGLPTLLHRPLLEVSLYHETDRQQLADTCAALGTDYRVVADRVGLVTPRVICQIINEAYCTIQEGTATKTDVDLAMRLGTNYPHGPFAWAEAIGLERVYAVLESLWADTHDERYKVCPLLKKEALRDS